MSFSRRDFLRCAGIGVAGIVLNLNLNPYTNYSSQERLKDIMSVQPLKGPVGLVYYLDVKYNDGAKE